MGRKWLGVSSAKYKKMPHVEDGPPPSLWWYRRQPDPSWADDTPMPESQCVIDTYIRQCSRGRTLPAGFEKNLVRWLQDLSRPEKISPRRKRYWSIPAYALAHKLYSERCKPSSRTKGFCKRFRELERIAIHLFPTRVPPGKEPRPPLTEDEKQALRQEYLAGVDAKELAEKFRIAASHVGRLCREQKAMRAAEREKWENQSPSSSPAAPQDEPDQPF